MRLHSRYLNSIEYISNIPIICVIIADSPFNIKECLLIILEERIYLLEDNINISGRYISMIGK